MFAEKDSWQDYVTACWEIEQPRTEYTREEQCPMFMVARNLQANTVADGFAAMFADMDTFEAQVRWVAMSSLDITPAPIRKGVFDALLARSPAEAGIIYAHSDQQLTLAERERLKSVIAKHMPVMHQKIEGGLTTKFERGEKIPIFADTAAGREVRRG